MRTPRPLWGTHQRALVLAPSGVQSPSSLLTTPSSCQSVAPQDKAPSVDTWRLVWGEIGSRSSLGEVTVLDAPGSPFWELENAIRDSEVSGNLAHELLPLPGPTVTLFLSTHLSSLVLLAAQDGRIVGLCSCESDQLFLLRWLGRFVAVSCPAYLSEAQETCFC